MSDVNWKVIRDHRDPHFMVKGYVLAQAIYPDSGHRFMIEEVRAMNADRSMGIRYYIRDAHTVSDVDLKAGIRSRVVAYVDTWPEVRAYCDLALVTEHKYLGDIR